MEQSLSMAIHLLPEVSLSYISDVYLGPNQLSIMDIFCVDN